ncbi:hypothetical protein ATCC90586_009135 [Pythium insidiosum]|nr:hypothetical protein ATCC90586_009135 [Pythium insidiosum]
MHELRPQLLIALPTAVTPDEVVDVTRLAADSVSTGVVRPRATSNCSSSDETSACVELLVDVVTSTESVFLARPSTAQLLMQIVYLCTSLIQLRFALSQCLLGRLHASTGSKRQRLESGGRVSVAQPRLRILKANQFQQNINDMREPSARAGDVVSAFN